MPSFVLRYSPSAPYFDSWLDDQQDEEGEMNVDNADGGQNSDAPGEGGPSNSQIIRNEELRDELLDDEVEQYSQKFSGCGTEDPSNCVSIEPSKGGNGHTEQNEVPMTPGVLQEESQSHDADTEDSQDPAFAQRVLAPHSDGEEDRDECEQDKNESQLSGREATLNRFFHQRVKNLGHQRHLQGGKNPSGRRKSPYDKYGKQCFYLTGPCSGLIKRAFFAPPGSGKKKNQRKSLCDRLKTLVRHEEDFYAECEKLYACCVTSDLGTDCFKRNKKPRPKAPAVITPAIHPLSFAVLQQYYVRVDVPPCMREGSDLAKGSTLRMSRELITKFLARVHAFTVVGLETIATAFSHDNGVIRYLALPPQDNRVDSVSEKHPSVKEQAWIDRFQSLEPGKTGGYRQRCFIYSCPHRPPSLTVDDVFRLYKRTNKNRSVFAVVISPRISGPKMLCFHLTRDGFRAIQTCERSNKDKQHVIDFIAHSSTPFYCQIPIELVEIDCRVVDLRSAEEVTSQLNDYIKSGEAGKVWA